MSVEVVLKNCTSVLGEGPHWDDATQCLLYVDIEVSDIGRWNSVTGENQKIHLDGRHVGYVVPRRKGGYVAGLGHTFSHIEWDTGNVTTLAKIQPSENIKFNDGKCDPAGRIWAGTVNYNMETDKLKDGGGSLYSLDTSHKLSKHLDNLTIANGLAWTGDKRTMFYIDSTPKKVWAFDYDITTGTIDNQRTVVEFGEGMGNPDGMTIDTDDKIWVAGWGPGKVFQFDPETGKTLRSIQFPVSFTSSCCWGGENLDELYVTSSSRDVSEEDFRTKQPLAGSIFKVKELGVKGRPANIYEG